MLKVKMTFCPSMTKCPKDIMPKMTTCPKSHIIIKEISPMPKLTKCVQIWPEISRFWQIFKFRPITIFW